MKVLFISIVTAFLAVGCMIFPEDQGGPQHDSGYSHDRGHDGQQDGGPDGR